MELQAPLRQGITEGKAMPSHGPDYTGERTESHPRQLHSWSSVTPYGYHSPTQRPLRRCS